MKRFARWLYLWTHQSEIKTLMLEIQLATSATRSAHPSMRELKQERVNNLVEAGTILKLWGRKNAKRKT